MTIAASKGNAYTGISAATGDTFPAYSDLNEENTSEGALSVLEGRLLAVSVVDTSASPPFVGSVTIQRRFNANNPNDWRNWKTYTAQAEDQLIAPVNCQVRVAITALSGGNVLAEVRVAGERP